MTTEQLLFFVILIAIPLIQQLVRVMRARTGDAPTEGAPVRDEATVVGPRAPVSVEERGAESPLPEASLPPALPQAATRAAREPLPASVREPRTRRERKHGAAPSVRVRGSALPMPARRVIAGGNLRGAIVLMTILGPCRALVPKDPSQPG